jgi:site-specific recombinase XerD
MKYIVHDRVVRSRLPEGPLAAHIDSFADWADKQGYVSCSVYRRVLLGACFSEWLGKKGVRLQGVSSEHPSQYLRYRARQVRIARGDAEALRQLIAFFRCSGHIPQEKTPQRRPTPSEECAEAFQRYLREDRALSRATEINYLPFICSFLKACFGNGPAKLSQLRADDVVRFVQNQAKRLHRKRAKLMTSALRSFLQYARYRGDITLDLMAAVPSVANWSMASIPRAIPADQVRQLLASIKRHTAVGLRDYAILLLLARLGLRSGEVAFLQLEDIDWKAGRLSVCGKDGRRTDLPLQADVGKAIAAYLRHGRPTSTSRLVFLRARAPIRGFLSQCAIGSIVKHRLERAGIVAPAKGAHQFRHALATGMLRQGASLAEIGEVLGHRHPDTTRIYAKVDLDGLRKLALPWPGGVR